MIFITSIALLTCLAVLAVFVYAIENVDGRLTYAGFVKPCGAFDIVALTDVFTAKVILKAACAYIIGAIKAVKAPAEAGFGSYAAAEKAHKVIILSKSAGRKHSVALNDGFTVKAITAVIQKQLIGAIKAIIAPAEAGFGRYDAAEKAHHAILLGKAAG